MEEICPFGEYDPKRIEKRWQDIWETDKPFCAGDDHVKPKYYALIEFPYPSGEGLHVGHLRPYTALDIISRKRRLQGYNVLFPVGWDAFGLPTENYAIKNKIHPKKVTERNVNRFKNQIRSLGLSFDWSREINTTDPDYYKWTQWIFLKLFEKGLAYKKEAPINWCTDCKVGLANEEVVNGVCERCGGEVIKKVKNQWMLKITDYAEKLINDLDTVDFLDRIKIQQINWIGRSEGAEVDFRIDDDYSIRVYTTRPDTLFGATYMVVAPEHPMLDMYKDRIANTGEIRDYRDAANKKSDFERTELVKEKTGVEIKGVRAINPVNGKSIPIWVSDYVLMSYGTGAIMAVPGHDARDWEFAHKFGLPVIEVVKGGDIEKEAFVDMETGMMVNSGFLDGLEVKAAKERITDWLEEQKCGVRKVNYKLRDWVFSRQRYWGEPIPLIYCEKCGWVPVPENELPLLLPEVESYEPTSTGESPLANMTEWLETACPKCGGNGRRETDTMPQWAGSSWYFLRYIDPKNDRQFAGERNIRYWMPVDWYNGGMEHTTLHLLYSRFWHKFLYDNGYVTTPEPYSKRTSHGMILGENNEKMSKSRGNVVNPDDVSAEYGADTLRMYIMFIGDFEKAVPWSQNGVKGCRRFLERVWRLPAMLADGPDVNGGTDGAGNAGSAGCAVSAAGAVSAFYSPAFESAMHRTIKKVSEDIEQLKFNTAIASMMSLLNEFYALERINRSELKTFLLLLNPFAPHISEEIWRLCGYSGFLNGQIWPAWDESKTIGSQVEIAVQLNGRVRERIFIATGLDRDSAERTALQHEAVKALIQGKQIVKVITVPDKLINIVAR